MRLSRTSYIAHAFKHRSYHNFKLTVVQENEDYCLESSQQSEDPQYQDIGHMYSLDSFGDVYHFSRFAHIFVLLSPFVLTFGMRGLYNELKWHDFTLGRLENSSVHEDPKIYANNCLLIRMGPEFSSDIAGDGPEYCDTEVSDNYSSVEDSESPSTGTIIKIYLVTNEYDGDFVKPDNCWLGFYFVLFMASYVLHPPGFFRGRYIRCFGKNSDGRFL